MVAFLQPPYAVFILRRELLPSVLALRFCIRLDFWMYISLKSGAVIRSTSLVSEFCVILCMQVIEMSGVSAASDIWSVGCTVIELLTCVPPYYDLQPMPALFRVVQVLYCRVAMVPFFETLPFQFWSPNFTILYFWMTMSTLRLLKYRLPSCFCSH